MIDDLGAEDGAEAVGALAESLLAIGYQFGARFAATIDAAVGDKCDDPAAVAEFGECRSRMAAMLAVIMSARIIPGESQFGPAYCLAFPNGESPAGVRMPRHRWLTIRVTAEAKALAERGGSGNGWKVGQWASVKIDVKGQCFSSHDSFPELKGALRCMIESAAVILRGDILAYGSLDGFAPRRDEGGGK